MVCQVLFLVFLEMGPSWALGTGHFLGRENAANEDCPGSTEAQCHLNVVRGRQAERHWLTGRKAQESRNAEPPDMRLVGISTDLRRTDMCPCGRWLLLPAAWGRITQGHCGLEEGVVCGLLAAGHYFLLLEDVGADCPP